MVQVCSPNFSHQSHNGVETCVCKKDLRTTWECNRAFKLWSSHAKFMLQEENNKSNLTYSSIYAPQDHRSLLAPPFTFPHLVWDQERRCGFLPDLWLHTADASKSEVSLYLALYLQDCSSWTTHQHPRSQKIPTKYFFNPVSHNSSSHTEDHCTLEATLTRSLYKINICRFSHSGLTWENHSFLTM